MNERTPQLALSSGKSSFVIIVMMIKQLNASAHIFSMSVRLLA